MTLDFQSDRPIYLQIAEQIEDAVFTGAFPEETQVPSTTEISVAFKINPATVLKGMNLLVEKQVLYKRRGVGMFVSSGAQMRIRAERKEQFFQHYIESLLVEAKKLGFSKAEVLEMIERGFRDEK